MAAWSLRSISRAYQLPAWVRLSRSLQEARPAPFGPKSRPKLPVSSRPQDLAVPECLSCAIAADAGLRHEVITQAHQVAVTEGVSDDGYRGRLQRRPAGRPDRAACHAHVPGGRSLARPPRLSQAG